MGEKDDDYSENSWISDGLPSSSSEKTKEGKKKRKEKTKKEKILRKKKEYSEL